MKVVALFERNAQTHKRRAPGERKEEPGGKEGNKEKEKRGKKEGGTSFFSSSSRVKSIRLSFFRSPLVQRRGVGTIGSTKGKRRRKKSDCPVCWTGSADSAGLASNTSGAYQALKRKIPI